MNEHGNNQARPESDAAAERQNNQAASPRTETPAAEAPVDVIAIAREATLREQEAAGMSGAIKLIAPAKVNLFLGIGALRDDGFHEALNVMHAVNLHDVLTMRVRPAEDAGAAAADGGAAPEAPLVRTALVAREGLEAPEVASDDNIASRAVRALAQAIAAREGTAAGTAPALPPLDIHIEKHIPHQAGLGGGSSDAAAALVGAARLWGLDSNDPLIEDVAHGIGADVAFFLHGGCACFVGAGERFDHELVPMKHTLVLIKPQQGVSTSAAYRTFDEAPVPIPADVADAARRAQSANDVPLGNNLAPAAERLLPELAGVRSWALAQPGIQDALLCGSGSTTFAVCEGFDAATRVAAAARARGWWARTTAFGSAKAAIVS